MRPCIDLRRVNDVTQCDPFPLPRIEELIEGVGKSKYISKFDMTKGYFQIRLDPETRNRSAFVTPQWLYQSTVMPFGTNAASSCFQRMVQQVLAGAEEYSGAFIDDIVVFSQSFEEHLTHLEDVLERLDRVNLTVKPSKSQVSCARIPYLGHLAGAGEMRPLEAKVETLRQFPVPETKKQVRGFLGLAGYYSKYIPNYASLVAVLTDLTRKTEPRKVKWTEDCDVAFNKVKQILCAHPVLTLPDFSKRFIVQVDASERGLGAILCQEDEEGVDAEDDTGCLVPTGQHPVVYASRKLVPREQHLATTEKECLGIVWAVGIFKSYITGRRFVIQVDHNPLIWLSTVKDHNQKLLR